LAAGDNEGLTFMLFGIVYIEKVARRDGG